MTSSFIRRDAGAQTLNGLAPSSRDDIVRMAKAAGLQLPDALMDELCAAYPAFEAMVRRLPRARDRFDEPAHHLIGAKQIAVLN